MTWNPRDHHGVRELKTPAASIWLPDIVLINRWVNAGHSSFPVVHKVANRIFHKRNEIGNNAIIGIRSFTT